MRIWNEKNTLKKLYCLFILSIIIYILPNNVLAKNNFTYDDYINNINEGYIDKSVRYDDILGLLTESENVEKTLNTSNSFLKVYSSNIDYYSKITLRSSSFSLKPGDVLITNSTSFYGLTGHAAIALNSSSILEIPGKNRLVRVVRPSTFRRNNSSGWIKVYRPRYSSWGVSAASWANKYYRNSKAKYKISFDINSIKETYCSKIVFQAYKFGVGKKAFKSFDAPSAGNINAYGLKSIIVSPYNLPKYIDII